MEKEKISEIVDNLNHSMHYIKEATNVLVSMGVTLTNYTETVRRQSDALLSLKERHENTEEDIKHLRRRLQQAKDALQSLAIEESDAAPHVAALKLIKAIDQDLERI